MMMMIAMIVMKMTVNMVNMDKHGESDHEDDHLDDHVCERDIDASASDIAPFLLLWFLWLLHLFAEEQQQQQQQEQEQEQEQEE